MRSSSGEYFAGLDHVRAFAAFAVVVWHFSHWIEGYPVPFNQAPEVGLLDEGHVGVAIFMTLSGYLFAKLIGDRKVDYPSFLWNRALRLVPLLAFVLVMYAIQNRMSAVELFRMTISGIVEPSLPHGGWSITVEAHFYVVLPLLLAALRRDARWVALFLIASLTLRYSLYLSGLDVQHFSYLTIVGRVDQFILGVAAFRLRHRISGRVALLALIIIWSFYAAFDAMGGFYGMPYDALWIFIPLIEGATFAVLIAWYDRNPLRDFWILRKAGEYSYSIYLLHFFFVRQVSSFIHEHVMPLTTLYHALPWAVLFFLFMMMIGHLSWKLIESPPLRWRRRYLTDAVPTSPAPKRLV